MGQNSKWAGSNLLGAELRRLRGGRTIEQIAKLSRSPAFEGRVKPLSIETLSQLEQGLSPPSLEALRSLALLHGVSAQRLLDFSTQEQLAEAPAEPTSMDEARKSFAAALEAGKWSDGLAIAAWGEQNAEDPGRSVLWRANRALCAARLGMRQEAILTLHECCSDPDLPKDRLYQVYQTLADVFSEAGSSTSAALYVQAALDAAPMELEAADRARLLTSRAYLLLTTAEQSDQVDVSGLREAIRLLEQVEALDLDFGPAYVHDLNVHQALGYGLLGDTAFARSELERIASEADEAELDRSKLLADLNLGLIERRSQRPDGARAAYERAAELAERLGEHGHAFEAHFELYGLLAGSESDEARKHLERCDVHHPLLQINTNNARRYERLTRES